MLIDYARNSTNDQSLDLQNDALHKAGCDKIHSAQIGGATPERPGFTIVFDVLRPGATPVIRRLDRLGRSLKHLIQIVEQLNKRKVGLKSRQENMDTTTTGVRLAFHLFGALAGFEPNHIRECTQAECVNVARACKMRDLTVGLGVCMREMKALFRNQLEPYCSKKLQEKMPAAGLPM
ncbi:MAG: recombinase family protein [Oryzomonas sp.]|uniref:recombinase family protein n=1 Tax=Oryzomonas sp. TaxID=2855186 RepID=UPI00283D8F8E|nr:recombinase family protein [Oryzomonas sp.]MDR3579794.1 recombinase family protein [Oryzomonas sp.]